MPLDLIISYIYRIEIKTYTWSHEYILNCNQRKDFDQTFLLFWMNAFIFTVIINRYMRKISALGSVKDNKKRFLYNKKCV